MNSHELVDQYLSATLAPQLQNYELSPREIEAVTTDVRSRLAFLLSIWRDHLHSRTLLISGIEEATFYQPTRAPLWVRALVVLAVRNSLLENFHADPVNKIPDDAIPLITAAASKAFASIDHLKLSRTAAHQADMAPDSLHQLPNLYPIAWKALSALSQLDARSHSYSPESVLSPPLLPPSTIQDPARQESIKTAVASGVSGEITPQLREQLEAIATGQIQAFFAPSFKFVTRNTGLLFYVINFVLAHGGSFATLNYYLRNGFVSARKNLLRPPHYVDESWGLLLRREGIDQQHAMVLKAIETQFNER